MLTITEIQDEAVKFRKLIEICDKSNTSLVMDCFPVMSCKLSSMLLSYHFLKLWPDLSIKGISAATGKNGQITHYWLEINDIAIDITGDQYNLIGDNELNKKIIQRRPFPAVHVSHKEDSYLYKLFKIKDEDLFVHGFPSIGEDYIEEMKLSYKLLLN
ncbi:MULTISPECIES: hypothetical protein [Enterobacteriaceae]|uniref:Uncharacterized protein n=3 Tax=Salmonella enterica TaxID=28901 RepID=A0A8E9ZGV3_SALER|nr:MULTISPECIES: hypothetical protein [Enterobacteriaceae]EAA6041299.1 hypothetical protein [Salmonella enterica subsp. diarizonae]ECI2309883.1 hypothetical protein [Salmonella enterica subsp. enterica serovar Infantis]ECJ5874529.1 hypothetical protein [Salmonella enterica subsp. salamae]ESJ14048.1 hypothetical protein SED60170_24485 [Salmonella enterica subsp. diarizonae serovar 60:r:e,n,x,z15 str. 01-0170]HDS9272469.1 hypothetical protein [Klebsiella pneumoniae subsp. pneumoniae]